MEKINFDEKLLKKIKTHDGLIHLVLIATKPDIIKQAPLVLELKKRNEFVLVVHSGQHYDWNLSGGLEEEFNIYPDINLNIKGLLYEQQSQIIDRLGFVLSETKKIGKLVVPYIYGDTTTAVAGGIASFANLIGAAHVEAGLRTMSPPEEFIMSLLENFNVTNFFEDLKETSLWKKGSYEPYPEQFDTRAAAPSAGVHFAPTRINSENLLDEGYASERVFVVGNPVSDTIKLIEKQVEESNIFDKYPILAEGGVIRFCVHRRENIKSYHRFMSIYESIVELVKEGRTVLFISLGATEKALEVYKLKEKTLKLAEKYKNFIYSQVWPNYADVIAAMKKCSAVVTDSGSIQEETNILGLPGVILRFNSDRPEAIFSGSNILAPPISKEVILKIVRQVVSDKDMNMGMRNAPKLYGKEVCGKTIDIINRITKKEYFFNLFKLMEHDRLGLSKMPFWRKGETTW
jgi:UDP-N-acetylglucosamine 2-epimerase (non-hydrolysing)